MAAVDELVEPLRAGPDDNYLPGLAAELQVDPGLAEPERSILVQALLVAENYIWSRSRWKDYRRTPFFVPAAMFHRSDLTGPQAMVLRSWASRSKNAAARARFFD